MDTALKKNISMVLLIVVVGLQFFSYLGSGLISLQVSKCIHGVSRLKRDIEFVDDWILVTIFGRIIGGYALYKLAHLIGFFKVMRIVVIGHILLALSLRSYTFTDMLLYQDLQFLFAHRFIHAFLVPASFMLPSLFLLTA